MPSGLFYLNSLDQSISKGVCVRGMWSVSIITIEMPVVIANSVDPDQTPRCAASDLGLHCLPMSQGINGLNLMFFCCFFYICHKMFVNEYCDNAERTGKKHLKMTV